jgi:NitT/TauT family transport system ATP-binding protein
VNRPLSQEKPISMAPPDAPMAGKPAVTADHVFECADLSLEFATPRGPLTVLENVGFTVAPGEFVSIVGQSGTGKSTLLRILGGLQRAGAGSRVLYRGEPVTAPPADVIVVFQDYRGSLLPWRTVERNVTLGLEGVLDATARRERCSSALELVGLADRAKDYPWRLSGGMQQRVQIARALAMQPQVLLMDEPFGALDAMTKAQLQDELQTVHKVTGATIVFVTHDIEEAVYLSDRVLVLAGQPANITAEVRIPLDRPRDQITTKELPDYLEFRHAAHMALRGLDVHR